MRISLLALLMAAAASSFAQTGPAPVAEFATFESLNAQANDLRDAVAAPNSSDVSVKARSDGFFDKLPVITPVFPVYYRRVDRAETTGKIGTLDGMQAAAEKRVSWWKVNRHTAVPAKLDQAVAAGRAMKDSKRIQFEATLARKQMGMFRYRTDANTGGTIDINERMKLFCALIGDEFCYATTVHELTHLIDREEGRLSPEKWREGEVSAFKSQHDWIKIVDENGEKLVTKHSELALWRDREKEPMMKELLTDAVEYLEHLSEVVATNAHERELYDLVDRLYKGKPHGHEHTKS